MRGVLKLILFSTYKTLKYIVSGLVLCIIVVVLYTYGIVIFVSCAELAHYLLSSSTKPYSASREDTIIRLLVGLNIVVIAFFIVLYAIKKVFKVSKIYQTQ